ncbi:aldehyde dehydrogenase family protein [Amycolatopsis acidicola]|uniref:Aldehyde dehydrogenase family protein n=1 Tax=Amycolatopsis acidicola TaxID=2596893 RepID=A0A5N0US96_9PSEU|nr:aldehyde dehydrogenase family protein [Amycolatopsis acidicola]KAA9152318.1 aldehyde dehydrogenase family protein [Amycolatopsis acidicola]
MTLPDTSLRIDGAVRPAGNTFSTLNPVTEQEITRVSAASESDVDDAVAAARRQFDDGPWGRMDGPERGRILARAADLIEADLENLATLEALEVGKPYADTLHGDLPAAVETFRSFAGWADKLFGSTSTIADPTGRERLSYTLREPAGVVGAITPWNNPAMIAAWKLAPALAAGCAVVLKPPEDASLSTLRLADLLAEAGLPPGVLNVVPGLGPVAGAALAGHPGVDKVTFTGSPAVGHRISLAAGANFRKVTLELGGKAPQLVFPDSDLDEILPTVALGIFLHGGQVCAAGTRILVHHSIMDKVLDGLATAAARVRLGDPFDADTTMGPLINARQRDRVWGYIEAGLAEGAEVVAGGVQPDGPGFFVTPTVFRGDNGLKIAREEIFGPVGTVIGFESEEEAVALANDTPYGLSAMVWTNDVRRAHRVTRRLRVGMVWVNGWGVPDQRMPWGGRGGSGVGRELGLAGLEANTTEKTVSMLL